MEYKFNQEHLDLVREQVWECKDDLSVYGKLSELEYSQFGVHLPVSVQRSFEIGAGMGRGSIQLAYIYPEAQFTLADRQGRTENKGIFHPEVDEYYNDFNLTKSFCKLNGLPGIQVFDTELDDWSTLPKFDLITSRCSIGFHVPLERYINKLISISTPDVTIIFGMNGNYIHEAKLDTWKELFREVYHIYPEPVERFPFQSWLIFKGINS